MKRLLLLMPVILVLLTSGCTIPGTGINIPFIPDLFGQQTIEYTDDIVIIRNLQVTPSTTINEDQTLNVYADVQSLEKAGRQTISVDVEMYDYCTNLFQGIAEDKTHAECPDTPAEKDKLKCTITLLPQETKTVKWVLKPDKNIIDLTSMCNLKIKAGYAYETKTITQITYINSQELAAKIRRGESWQIQGTSVIGEGPVKPYLKVEDNQPVSAESQASVSLTIKNVGFGYVTGSEVKDYSLDFGNFGKEENCNTDGNYKKLIGKETSPLMCTLKAPEDTSIEIEKTFDLKATISYDYEFRKDVQVTIQPIFGAGGGSGSTL